MGPTVQFLVVFIKSILQSLPDILLHENVVQFPIHEISDLLQGLVLNL